ncbi:MAG: WHG domain-containing protein [Actinomycetota bacterium]
MPASETSSRAPYDGDLRRALIDAAVAVVADEDPANLSLRAVARDLGVSHAAPKNHFTDKTALLTAIAIEGFERLAHELLVAIDEAASPLEALATAGRSYVRFSVGHPGYFRVMWRNDLLDQGDQQLERSGELALDALRQLVREAQATGWATGRSATDLAVLAWAAVHGLAQLYLDGPLGALVEADIDQLTATTVELLTSRFG